MIGLVLTVLLASTLLSMSLLALPGGIRHQVKNYEHEIANVYREESAIIAWMEQFPEGYFGRSPWNLELPAVEMDDGFPWAKVSAAPEKSNSREHVVAWVGATFRPLGSEDMREMKERLVANLNREILGRSNLKVKSGNRRLTGRGENVSMSVTAGDLTLEFEGPVESVNLRSDGNINVRGSARYDTLHLYAAGEITFSGTVNVKHLEAYSGGNLTFSRDVAFSGVAISNSGVFFRDKSRMEYPAVVASLGKSVQMKSSASCADSSAGKLRLVSAAPNRQESEHKASWQKPVPLRDIFQGIGVEPLHRNCMLPAFLGGKLLSIRWGVE